MMLKLESRRCIVVGGGEVAASKTQMLLDCGAQVVVIAPRATESIQALARQAKLEWTAREFVAADLFNPPAEWKGAFDFVLEIYTIQPLPLEMRPQVIDAISAFVAPKGELVVVTRGRDDNEEPEKLPWPMSRKDLSRFEENGLTETSLVVMPPDEEDEPDRFVVAYSRV